VKSFELIVTDALDQPVYPLYDVGWGIGLIDGEGVENQEQVVMLKLKECG